MEFDSAAPLGRLLSAHLFFQPFSAAPSILWWQFSVLRSIFSSMLSRGSSSISGQQPLPVYGLAVFPCS